MQARVYGALVPVILATGAFESGETNARMVAHAVDAGGAVQARRRVAVVDVDLAVGATESGHTKAVVAVDQIRARSIIGTGGAVAFVHILTIRRRSCNAKTNPIPIGSNEIT